MLPHGNSNPRPRHHIVAVPDQRSQHAWIGDATVADAILDRLLSRNHRLNLKGKSMRPSKAVAVQTEGTDTATPLDTAA